jgi:hypothetical protein
MRHYIIYILKKNFLPAFFKAYTKIITPKNGRANFKTASFIPFNLQVIILQLNIMLIFQTSLLLLKLLITF